VRGMAGKLADRFAVCGLVGFGSAGGDLATDVVAAESLAVGTLVGELDTELVAVELFIGALATGNFVLDVGVLVFTVCKTLIGLAVAGGLVVCEVVGGVLTGGGLVCSAVTS
jgi:hypothetical protein